MTVGGARASVGSAEGTEETQQTLNDLAKTSQDETRAKLDLVAG